MKKIAIILMILILLFPTTSIAISKESNSIGKTQSAAPGEIIAVSCSEPYPTLGQPVHLLITMVRKCTATIQRNNHDNR